MKNPTGWRKTNHRGMTPNHVPACPSTICVSDSELPSSSTLASASPYESSYEIICAEDRRPPSNEYLLFELQPASTIPYTLIDAMAKMTRTATFTSATCSRKPCGSHPNKVVVPPNGTTAKAAKAHVAEIIGARAKSSASAARG